MKKQTVQRNRGATHVGPGKKIVSVYLDGVLHEVLKRRAKEKRLSLSHYLRESGIADVGANSPGKDAAQYDNTNNAGADVVMLPPVPKKKRGDEGRRR